MNKEHSLYYEDEYYMFGAFSAHAVEYNWILYPTAEHAYQAVKFKGNHPEIHDIIVKAKSPLEAKKLKDKYKDKVDSNFEENKVKIMEDIFRKKTKQHEEVRKALISSKDTIIWENSPVDEFRWVWKNKDWENMLWKIRMKIRKDLINNLLTP